MLINKDNNNNTHTQKGNKVDVGYVCVGWRAATMAETVTVIVIYMRAASNPRKKERNNTQRE